MRGTDSDVCESVLKPKNFIRNVVYVVSNFNGGPAHCRRPQSPNTSSVISYSSLVSTSPKTRVFVRPVARIYRHRFCPAPRQSRRENVKSRKRKKKNRKKSQNVTRRRLDDECVSSPAVFRVDDCYVALQPAPETEFALGATNTILVSPNRRRNNATRAREPRWNCNYHQNNNNNNSY